MSVYKGDDIIAGTSVGFVRELAWSAKQQIASVPFTAPKDGMIIGTCASDGTGNDHADYYLNGVPVGTSHHVQNVYCAYANMTIPVKAGDVFSAAEWSLPYSAMWFVPYEDSTVSDVEVVTPEYIRNMNTPDWSNGVLIPFNQTQSDTWTIPSNGMLVGNLHAAVYEMIPSGGTSIVAAGLNNVFIWNAVHSKDKFDYSSPVTMSVNKGDVFYINRPTDHYTIERQIYFIPYKQQ